MKKLFKSLFVIACCMSLGLTSCSKGDDEPGGDKTNSGGYGDLNGKLVAIGGTRDVTYTNSVILGMIDFTKISKDHRFGIVYMESVDDESFDYGDKLRHDGKSRPTDKIQYRCNSESVTNTTADGRFEKELVGLKPGTRYYYRAYAYIGETYNYSDVNYFDTTDPSPDINMSTAEATNVLAVASTLNGVVNIGNLSDVNEDQSSGFIISDDVRLSTPACLSYEYYEEWTHSHFETEEDMDSPKEVIAKENKNGRISCDTTDLVPGRTYYYRTFFKWNNKYFYSSDVKSLRTLGAGDITVGTTGPTDVNDNSAVLNGTVPFNKIGKDEIRGGFMISSVYKTSAEFVMENEPHPWGYGQADLNYITTTVTDTDFSAYIGGLQPNTTYYVRAFVKLGGSPESYEDYDDDDVVYIYGSMQHFTTPDVPRPESSLGEVETSGTYRWTLRNGVWISGNAGVARSSSVMAFDVTHAADVVLSFDWTVSSESNYDKLIVKIDGREVMVRSGEDSGTFNHTFTTQGVSRCEISYGKDSSGDDGLDRATVQNIAILE